MRNAPSVLIPVGRSRWGAAVLAAAWLAGWGVLLAWRWQVPTSGDWAGLSGAQATMALMLGVTGVFAFVSHRRTRTGWLDGDGRSWCWTTAQGDCEAQVNVMGDWQRVILVRLIPADGSGAQWLWLVSHSGPEHWRAVRRALYFRGAREAPPDGMAATP
ncbi:MAG: hypothetical protein RL522_863 [Pseudomonadota bacterium]|jgi:hypothetical protein